jgi:hypothetical protein
MTKVIVTEKNDRVQLTDKDLEIVTGGNKSKHSQREFLLVKLTEVFIT